MAGSNAQKNAQVTGITTRYIKEPVKLYAITHGRLTEIASSKVDGQGRFGFLFYPEEGFYVVGNGPEAIATDKYAFYFRPGDQLNLRINDSSYSLAGDNTKENRAIAQWHDLLLPLERKAYYFSKIHSNYTDFFPDLESRAAAFGSYRPATTGNPAFDALFARQREIDLLGCALEFLNTPRSVHPAPAELSDYYRKLSLAHFTTDTRLLGHKNGARLLGNLQRLPFTLAGRKQNWSDLEERLEGIANDTLRGEIVLSSANALKTYLGYLDMEQRYGKYILTGDQAARFKEVAVKLAQQDSKPGQPAINFSYPDLNGKMTSLSDFKGKVVLVDVWATWCGPCKAELPALKKMEEELRGRDIVFMSVSVDEEKDKEKWKDFVAKEDLKGVQLFASGWSDIAKNYNIKGIPRFMVFDRKGNIVTIDSPRPSSKELKLLLESELKK